ncbi:peptidylprolyl isomerase [Sphingomonas sp. SM33]|uniref:Peptidyl-prolyl cis-trans isomerase n=1 Tax=Sphingomonas telluris TaxID=2907998 RepID=A0ABS9VNU9_9SPHN|nr:peptidylprolyl isomerase [Sphingomonas telluris]MCH8616646.1 peptidylprolyl isomerase [Sphingomonas telluris]
MMIRFAFALSLLLASPVAAQTAPAAPAPAEDQVKVALDTSAGRIVLALDRAHAPITTANFLKYVDAGRFNGESFYRAMKFTDGGGIIQGGITSDARKLYPAIKHEPVSETGIRHVAGTVSMAAFSPGSAKADFFILTTDIPSFDKNFAAFGHVVEGMDVVKSILVAPTSPTKGEGVMRGQMLDPVVKITKATRVAG